MAAPDAKGTERGAPSGAPPLWQSLRYPDDATFTRLTDEYPELTWDEERNDLKPFLALPPWLRLGWPSADLYTRAAKGNPALVRKKYADVLTTYPNPEDVERVLRYWPDAFGQPLVNVDIGLQDGITINDLTYGPGTHQRIPSMVAATLRHIDQRARQEFIDQFIPRVHAEKVLATLSMKAGGEIR